MLRIGPRRIEFDTVARDAQILAEETAAAPGLTGLFRCCGPGTLRYLSYRTAVAQVESVSITDHDPPVV